LLPVAAAVAAVAAVAAAVAVTAAAAAAVAVDEGVMDCMGNAYPLFYCAQSPLDHCLQSNPTLYEKTAFWGHLYIKCIILPRQARDKHRENSKTMPFSQVRAVQGDDSGAAPGRQPTGLSVRRRKRSPFSFHFYTLKNDRFTKTGSGHT
jgi:hypothetical protein